MEEPQDNQTPPPLPTDAVVGAQGTETPPATGGIKPSPADAAPMIRAAEASNPDTAPALPETSAPSFALTPEPAAAPAPESAPPPYAPAEPQPAPPTSSFPPQPMPPATSAPQA